MIIMKNGKHCVVGKNGREFGCYGTHEEAQKRLGQVEMFKHVKEGKELLTIQLPKQTFKTLEDVKGWVQNYDVNENRIIESETCFSVVQNEQGIFDEAAGYEEFPLQEGIKAILGNLKAAIKEAMHGAHMDRAKACMSKAMVMHEAMMKAPAITDPTPSDKADYYSNQTRQNREMIGRELREAMHNMEYGITPESPDHEKLCMFHLEQAVRAVDGFRPNSRQIDEMGMAHIQAALHCINGQPGGVRESLVDVPLRPDFEKPIFTMREAKKKSDAGWEWDVVIIREGPSLNSMPDPSNPKRRLRLVHTAEYLTSLVPLLEGAPVNAFEYQVPVGAKLDHAEFAIEEAVPSGFAMNQVATLKDVKKDGSDVKGRLTILDNPVGRWLRESLLSIKEAGGRMPGLSINAPSMLRIAKEGAQEILETVKAGAVNSVEIVTTAAAGGKFLRMVASFTGAQPMKLKRVLETIRARFPKWIEGQDIKDDAQLVTVLESCAAKSVNELTALKEGDARTVALIAGVRSLGNVLSLAKESKADEAAGTLESWATIREAAANCEGLFDLPQAKAITEIPAATPATKGNDAESKQLKRKLFDMELREALRDSQLPEPTKAVVKKAFEGVEEPTIEKVREAILEQKDYLAKLQPVMATGSGPRGVDVKVTREQKDTYMKAFLGMLMERTIDGVRPFAGLHESFQIIEKRFLPKFKLGRAIMTCMRMSQPRYMDGAEPTHEQEYDEHHKQVRESMQGGWLPAPIRESLGTGDWAEVYGVSMFKALLMYGDQPQFQNWRRVVSATKNLDTFRTQRRVRIGDFNDLPIVAQKGAYAEAATPADEEVSYAPAKRGNIFKITREAVIDDDLNAITQLLKNWGEAAARTLDKFVMNDLFTSNPTMDYDAVALIAAAHNNNLTAALDAASLENAVELMEKQVQLSSGQRRPRYPKLLVVPVELRRNAWELTRSDAKIVSADNATTPNYFKQFVLEPIVNLWSYDANNWFLVADPKLNPTIEIGFLGGRQEPEMFVASAENLTDMLNEDTIVHKIRHEYGGDNLEHRSFVGSIVSGS